MTDTEISITWSVEDVEMVRPDLSRDQAIDVLHCLKNNHDADVGINWDVIGYTANYLFPKEESYE